MRRAARGRKALALVLALVCCAAVSPIPARAAGLTLLVAAGEATPVAGRLFAFDVDVRNQGRIRMEGRVEARCSGVLGAVPIASADLRAQPYAFAAAEQAAGTVALSLMPGESARLRLRVVLPQGKTQIRVTLAGMGEAPAASMTAVALPAAVYMTEGDNAFFRQDMTGRKKLLREGAEYPLLLEEKDAYLVLSGFDAVYVAKASGKLTPMDTDALPLAVTLKETPVYAGPQDGAPQTGTLPPGAPLLMEGSGSRCRVRSGQTEGYVQAGSVRTVETLTTFAIRGEAAAEGPPDPEPDPDADGGQYLQLTTLVRPETVTALCRLPRGGRMLSLAGGEEGQEADMPGGAASFPRRSEPYTVRFEALFTLNGQGYTARAESLVPAKAVPYTLSAAYIEGDPRGSPPSYVYHLPERAQVRSILYTSTTGAHYVEPGQPIPYEEGTYYIAVYFTYYDKEYYIDLAVP